MLSFIQVEKERDEAKQEAREAQLVAASADDAKAKVEVNLTKALNSLVAAEEGEHKQRSPSQSLSSLVWRLSGSRFY